MARFGLIGDPIEHSLSPALFRAGYGGKYVYDLIMGGDFETSFATFMEKYDGINVTAPFKEKAFLKIAEMSHVTISPECEKTGATNLIVKTAGSISAYNSDYLGLCEMIWKHFGISHTPAGILKEKKQALVVGCGGAGKAAAVAAADMNFDVCIMNRNIEKAEQFRDSIPEYGFGILPIDRFAGAFRNSDLIIYTLPCPIPGIETLDDSDLRGGVLRMSRKVLVEANYRSPAFTGETLERMQSTNHLIEYVPGSDWLLAQAAAGYALFTGTGPDTEAMAGVF